MHSPTRLYRELREKHHTGNNSYRPYYITPIPLRHPEFVSIRAIRGQPNPVGGDDVENDSAVLGHADQVEGGRLKVEQLWLGEFFDH